MGRKLLRTHDAFFLDISLPGYPLSHYPVEIRDDQITVVLFRRPHQELGGIRRHPVVAVQELDKGAPGLGQGLVPGRRDACVFLVEDAHPGIGRRIGVTQSAGSVLAAVVDKQQLKICIFLSQHTVHAAGQEAFCIVYRNDNGYGRDLSLHDAFLLLHVYALLFYLFQNGSHDALSSFPFLHNSFEFFFYLLLCHSDDRRAAMGTVVRIVQRQ